jgi:hypothetical protein
MTSRMSLGSGRMKVLLIKSALVSIELIKRTGVNTWLVVPNDYGVFDGATSVDGIRCAHPVQAYIDLKGQPEGSSEAAEYLRNQLVSGVAKDLRAKRDS